MPWPSVNGFTMGQREKHTWKKNRPKMVNERCVCLFVSKLDESYFLYKYWVGNISSSLFPFNPVKQGLSIPSDYISLYTKKEGERNKKPVFFLEWFQMKSDCSTRTVYLITSLDESNSFKLKTKQKKEWPAVFLIFQLCSYSSLAKASSPKAHERLPNSLDNTMLWTMNNIFLFSFFSLGADLFSSLVYTVLRFHFYCYYYYRCYTTTVYLAFPYP